MIRYCNEKKEVSPWPSIGLRQEKRRQRMEKCWCSGSKRGSPMLPGAGRMPSG